MNCRFSTGTNSHPCLAAVLGINRQSSWDCSGNFGIKCPRGAGAGLGVLSCRQDELCRVGCRPCIPKAVTRDMWSSGLQHPSSRSRSVHSCAASHALERSQARDVSPNTSSLAALPPLKDVVFPSLSVESLDVTSDFAGPLKPNFSFLSNLQVQRCPRRENLWSFFISVVP